MTPDPYAKAERKAIQEVEREEKRQHMIQQFEAAIEGKNDD